MFGVSVSADSTYEWPEEVPVVESKVTYREIYVKTTAYTLGDDWTPNEVMANGEIPFVGACAYNRVELGTVLEIDGGEYIVLDRCADDDTIDIYFNTEEDCENYGIQWKTIRIREED